MKSYTVNTGGNNVELAKSHGYHAYYASGITAIEIHANSKNEAKKKIKSLGVDVLYVFE